MGWKLGSWPPQQEAGGVTSALAARPHSGLVKVPPAALPASCCPPSLLSRSPGLLRSLFRSMSSISCSALSGKLTGAPFVWTQNTTPKSQAWLGCSQDLCAPPDPGRTPLRSASRSFPAVQGSEVSTPTRQQGFGQREPVLGGSGGLWRGMQQAPAPSRPLPQQTPLN